MITFSSLVLSRTALIFGKSKSKAIMKRHLLSTAYSPISFTLALTSNHFDTTPILFNANSVTTTSGQLETPISTVSPFLNPL